MRAASRFDQRNCDRLPLAILIVGAGGFFGAYLCEQNLLPGNKPLFGYFGKGGYNAASLDGRGSLQKLHSCNPVAAEVSTNRTLGRLFLK